MAAAPFYGETKCQSERCKNFAYWVVDHDATTSYYCGVHSKRYTETRRALVKNPARARSVLQKQAVVGAFIDRVLATCASLTTPGSVQCFRLTGFGRSLPFDMTHRQITIFPNNKHQHRSDGVGMPALSPMRLGPVKHRQPGVPDVFNIENYHQFSKCWPSEVGADGKVLDIWYRRRDAGFCDYEPHRHKFDSEQMAKERALVPDAPNPNAPLFALHKAQDGSERRFSYVESRAFYCCWYEVLARVTSEFVRLQNWRVNCHISLLIAGYDGYPICVDNLYEDYCDASVPFGHERVLAALLIGNAELPWRRFIREHADLYNGLYLPS